MELFTEDLILRTVSESDIEEVARMWEYPNETSLENAYQAIEYMKNTHSKNRPGAICHLCLAIYRKEEPRLIIGWCGLDGEAEPKKTVLFYMIEERFRNCGYVTQCAIELVRYAFEDMSYDIIFGGCAKENFESFRVMEKAGMKQSAFYENGDYIFSIKREEYINEK